MTVRARAGRASRLAVGVIVALGACAGALAYLLQRGPAVRLPTRASAMRPAELQTGNPRDFLTRDSVGLDGIQHVVRSRGTVVLVHGLGEPDSLFGQWAAALDSATQMNVLGVALRGNGRSRDSVSRGDGADAYALDVAAVIEELRRRNPSGPVLLLASHGGLGIVAHYERVRGARTLPAPDGIVALEADTGAAARVANGRALVLYATRLSRLQWLASFGVPVFDGLEIAMQESGGGEITTRWSLRAWRAATPALAPLLEAQAVTHTPLLVVARRSTDAPRASDRTWVTVEGAVDVNNVAVRRAIARWSATWSADAFEPVPPRPTQTLDILRKD